MKLKIDKNASNYVTEEEDFNQHGGSTILKDLAVPAGLFFLQRAFQEKSPEYKKEEGSDEMMPESLYDRLFSLVGNKEKRKTRKQKKGSARKSNRKTKKNN